MSAAAAAAAAATVPTVQVGADLAKALYLQLIDTVVRAEVGTA